MGPAPLTARALSVALAARIVLVIAFPPAALVAAPAVVRDAVADSPGHTVCTLCMDSHDGPVVADGGIAYKTRGHPPRAWFGTAVMMASLTVRLADGPAQ
jgi:hypothetical protein